MGPRAFCTQMNRYYQFHVGLSKSTTDQQMINFISHSKWDTAFRSFICATFEGDIKVLHPYLGDNASKFVASDGTAIGINTKWINFTGDDELTASDTNEGEMNNIRHTDTLTH